MFFLTFVNALIIVEKLLLKACQTGMLIVFAENLRSRMPDALLGCQLLKVPINKLDRAKMASVLRTAEAHPEIIVNCEEDDFVRMTMEAATKKWVEIVGSMDYPAECKDSLVFIGGNGKICKPVTTLKNFLTPVNIDELQNNCPILIDTDWFEKLSEFRKKKRTMSDAGWSDESQFIQESKKLETESENVSEPSAPDLNKTLEEFRLQSQQMLMEQRQESDRKMQEMMDHYEKRIQTIQVHQEFVATTTECREKQADQLVAKLEHQLREKDHEQVATKQTVTELQNKVQAFDEEKRTWLVEMAKLRDMIQSQQSVKKEAAQEPSAVEMTFGTVDMDSDEDNVPIHSSPYRRTRKINNLSKGLPTSLGKMGMPVFNPAKQSKIEYLSKFMMLVEDFDSNEDFKVIKQLVYQAFAEDRNFRIQDLTNDDKSTLEKLAKAIIKQDDGDSIDLMKTFETEQLKHGETHLNYLHRMSVLYEFATNFSDQQWKEQHIHAQKIYNKMDDALPQAARSKFRELMMDDRKKGSMTVAKIRGCLETVLLIFGDELKSAMGSQRHVVPMVDAIQSKSKPFPAKKKEVTCWKCGSTGHMKRFCPEKGNGREPKTSGRRGKVQCYSCQGFGHFSAQCPNKKNGQNKWSGETKKDQ